MNITELRYLVAVMKWGSVSAAAKQLYAAQPNVSKALKNLEEEYNLRIFERSSTGMIPTEQGRHFIEQAARVLEEVDRLDTSVKEERKRCAELRVMIPHATYASYAAVDFLEQASAVEELRIHIREGGSMEAMDCVLRRGYHLALLRYAVEDNDRYRSYCARRGRRHPLAAQRPPPCPRLRAVQPVFHPAAAALGLYVGFAHAEKGAGAVPSGAEKVSGPAPEAAGCAGVPGYRQPPARGAGIYRAAASAGGSNGEIANCTNFCSKLWRGISCVFSEICEKNRVGKFVRQSAKIRRNRAKRCRGAIYFLIWEPCKKDIVHNMKNVLT